MNEGMSVLGAKIWEELEPQIQSIILEKILQFHQALVDRGQIKPPPLGYGIPGDILGEK